MLLFWTGWALWIQLTFVLASALVVVIVIGMIKNLHVWNRNRRYGRLHGQLPLAAADLEVQTVQVHSNDPPFGIRALEQGIEIEGVFISVPNTPAPSSPAHSARSSPAPSVSGLSSPLNQQPTPISLHSNWSPTYSSSISPTAPIAMPQPLSPGYRPNVANLSRLTTTGQDVTFGNSLGSLDFSSDFQRHHTQSKSIDLTFPSSLLRNSATLDALEGRSRTEVRDRHGQSDSTSSSRSQRSVPSARDNSPSPPALTDGASRSDSPVSPETRPVPPTFLSESNHRLSHVAETGQIARRTRSMKPGDSVLFPSVRTVSHAFQHPSSSPFLFENRPPPLPFPAAVTFPPPPAFAAPRLAPYRSHTEPPLHSVHAAIPPESILNIDFEIPPLSPRNGVEHENPIALAFSKTSEPPSKDITDAYRMVNDNFQVREKGTRGSVALHEVLPSEPSTASVKKKRISRRLVKVRKGEVTRRLRAFSFPSGPQIVTA